MLRLAEAKTKTHRHTLTEDEKRDYLTAEICVMSMPGRANLPGAVTVFDDLVSSHQIQALQIHSTGVFLPYFRYMLHAHELFMRECGYTGTIPYVSCLLSNMLEKASWR